MKDVKTFVEEIFELEKQAQEAYWEEPSDRYNDLIDKLRSNVQDERVNFGMEKRNAPLSPFELKMQQLLTIEYAPRLILKVSEYKTEEEGKRYVIYTTVKNPHSGPPGLADAFVVEEQESKLMITAWWQFDDLDEEKHIWKFAAGNEELQPYTLGEFVSTERYQSPELPETAVQDYLSDI